MSIYEPMRLLQARQRERNELLPRLAILTVVVRFTGTGQHSLSGDEALRFGALLLEMPSFSYGVVAPYGLGGDMPLVSLAVTNWLVNDMGLYHGAELAARVWSPEGSSADTLDFHLIFSGSALRTTLPTDSA